jgi:predicted  nucleic acid-binding Zn-ribbon protein
LTSPYVRPDQIALADLERLLGHLNDELSAWRRRCQKAELQLQVLKEPGGMVPGDDVTRARGRMLELERENLDLQSRVDRAREMMQRLQQRLEFLEDAQPFEADR